MRSLSLFGVASLVGTVACVIPLDLEVIANESEYMALCRCIICTEVDPDTLECLTEVVEDTDLFECDEAPGQVDESLLEQIFMQVCDRSDSSNSTCSLEMLDMEGSPFVVLFGEETCPTATSVPLNGAPIEPLELATATVTSGQLEISQNGSSGSTSLSGTISFRGGTCATGTCPIEIVSIQLEGSDFDFDGTTIEDPFLFNTTIGTGTFTPAAVPVFTIEKGTLEIVGTGTAMGRRGVRAANTDFIGAGFLNQEDRLLTFAQLFTSNGTTLNLSLIASIDNLRPTVSLPGASIIECQQGGAALEIAANVIDVDGTSHTSQWFVNGELVATNVDTLETFVELGFHTIEVFVFDEDGGQATAQTTVTVEDTQPPEFVPTDPGVCLWPPNHERYILTTEELGVLVVDACDPDPSIVLSNGMSSQPDNGPGDGNTINDIVVLPGSVCVRGEREGGDPAGRTYNVTVTATDFSNNSDSTTAGIHVPQDQSPDDRCDLAAGTPVEELDQRCIPAAAPSGVPDTLDAPDSRDRVSPSGGCSVGSEQGGLLWTLIVFGLVLGVGRKRRAMLGALAALALFGGACGGDKESTQSCEASCLTGWWVRVAGTCDAACAASDPAPRECSQSDCEMIEARFFQADGAEIEIFPILHSATSRTFTTTVAPANSTWEIVGDCQMSLGGEAGRTFSCSQSNLTYPTAEFARADPALASKLDEIKATDTACEHSY